MEADSETVSGYLHIADWQKYPKMIRKNALAAGTRSGSHWGSFQCSPGSLAGFKGKEDGERKEK